ncbi:MAG TPA: response regulator [Candidatus Saccharimonadales bacterium]|nr:response regulator [Candidatus Saccharimonadales bacterium]
MASKVLLVEDDTNLREIYEARLHAEGYDIVVAKDGEEALVVAKQEQPELIIADVMMPRVSGFEMLDILRNTNELKYTKVIMLTALGQVEDQKRATQLGADRYLVKSQVTLEDIVKAAKELLGDSDTAAPAVPQPVAITSAPTPPTTASTNSTTSNTNDQLIADALQGLSTQGAPAATISAPTTPAATPTPTLPTPPAAPAQPLATSNIPSPAPVATAQPTTPTPTLPNDTNDDDVTIAHKKIISPPSESTESKPDLNELLAREDSAPNSSSQYGDGGAPAHVPGHIISPKSIDGISAKPNNL